MQAFCAAVETGNLTKAARRIALSKSMVSRRIDQLEGRLGVALFHRSPGVMTLSEAGRAYYLECSDILGRINHLEASGEAQDAKLSGCLRLQVLPGFALGPFSDAFDRFCALHPEIGFEVTVSDQLVDPVREGFDIVFQIYPAVNDSLVERRLFPHRGVFCAAPAYLERAPELREPLDLLRHRFVRYANYPWGDRWPLWRGETVVEVELTPALKTNSVHLLLDHVLSGAGVAFLPTMLASRYLASGELVHVLPGVSPPLRWMTAVYPPSHRQTAKVRAFLDFMIASFPFEPTWDSHVAEGDGALDVRRANGTEIL